MNESLKKEWEKTKKQLNKLSKNVVEIAKRSEKELIEISKKGKMQIDSAAIRLKKEHLYYQIGKEYSRLKSEKKQTSAKLKKLLEELKRVKNDQTNLKRKINSK